MLRKKVIKKSINDLKIEKIEIRPDSIFYNDNFDEYIKFIEKARKSVNKK